MASSAVFDISLLTLITHPAALSAAPSR
jgi:hypothetical protein